MTIILRDIEERLDKSLSKIDKISDLVAKVLREGIKFRLQVAGEEIPVVLIVEPDD